MKREQGSGGGAAAAAPVWPVCDAQAGGLKPSSTAAPRKPLTPRASPRAARQVTNEAVARGRWLVGLMAAQSLSSLILDNYSELLREHLVITLFLTML
jgi:hypothetical protein